MRTAALDQAWQRFAGGRSGEQPSTELRPLLFEVCRLATQQPADLAALKASLQRLLAFLASPAGRTSTNVRTVNLFFCRPEEWGGDWSHLPEEFDEILNDLGDCLHDTMSHPVVVTDFDSLPEQLLERVKRIEV